MISGVGTTPGSALNRIVELESLRGLLALWVICGHLLSASGFDAAYWPGPLKLIGRGIDAVDVFIILSGFVIWALLDRGGERYPAFILRRFMRLYPVYLVCLVAAILTTPLAVHALQSLPWDNAHNAGRLRIFADAAEYFPAQLAAHLSMLHGIFPDSMLPSSPYAFVGQAWSISLEWQFYLVAPLLFLACGRKPVALLTLLVLALALRWLSTKALGGMPPSFLLPKLWLFAVGICSHACWKRAVDIPAKAFPALLPALLCAAVATRSVGLALWSFVLYALLAARAGRRSYIARSLLPALQWNPVRWLGEVSYPLYLVHMVVLYVVLDLLTPYATTLGQHAHLAVLTVTVIALSIALSGLLHYWIEKPGIALGKKLGGHISTRSGTHAPVQDIQPVLNPNAGTSP